MPYSLNLPPPPIALEQTVPRRLIEHDKALGYFASAPQRLAPYLFLAAEPDEPQSTAAVADALVEAAAPDLTPDAAAIYYTVGRLSMLFTPKPPRYTPYAGIAGWDKQGPKIGLTETGRTVMPIAALMAAHWLQDQESIETLLPTSPTKYWKHGIRLACLQYCLTTNLRRPVIASRLGITEQRTRGILRDLRERGILRHLDQSPSPIHRVTERMQPLVTTIISELHSLKDSAYADTLRTDVIVNMVGNKDMYGLLARTALLNMAASKRIVPHRRLAQQ